jgi:hypothetical protein
MGSGDVDELVEGSEENQVAGREGDDTEGSNGLVEYSTVEFT